MSISLLTFGNVNRAFSNCTDNIANVLAVNYCFWPFINFMNFKYIPLKFRMLAVNLCGLLWNSFLAHTNQKSVDKKDN